MISDECISLDWINKVSAQNKDADRILVEKAIRALRLLEGLVEIKQQQMHQKRHTWQHL